MRSLRLGFATLLSSLALVACSAGGPVKGSGGQLGEQNSITVTSVTPTTALAAQTTPTVFEIDFKYDLQTVSSATVYAVYIGDANNDLTLTNASTTIETGQGSGSLTISVVAGAVASPANFAVGVEMVDPTTNTVLAFDTVPVTVQ